MGPQEHPLPPKTTTDCTEIRGKAMNDNDQSRLEHLSQHIDQLYEHGQLDAALTAALEAYSLTCQLDPRGVEAANSALRLARLYQEKDDITHAHEYYRAAIDGFKNALGPEHETVAAVIHAEGELYEAAGDLAVAAHCYKEAISIQHKVAQVDNPKLMLMFNNLALTQLRLGKIAEAQEAIEAGLQIAQEDSLERALLLSAQADVLLAQQDYVQADIVLNRALVLRRTALGVDHPLVHFTDDKLKSMRVSVAHRLRELTSQIDKYTAEKKFDSLLPLVTKTYEIMSHFFGNNHPHSRHMLGVRADLEHKSGFDEVARASLHMLLNDQRSTPNVPATEVANTLMKLGVVEAKLGNREVGEQHLLEALKVFDSTTGVAYGDMKLLLFHLAEVQEQLGKHEERAATLDELGQLAYRMSDYDQAANVFEALYKYICDYHLSEPNSFEATRILSWLAYTYQQLSNYQRAIPLQEQVVEIRQRLRAENETDYATSLHNLAAMYTDIHDYTRAEHLYKQAYEIRSRVFGHDHPDTAESLDGLGVVMFYTGRPIEAVVYVGLALHVRVRTYPHGHPDVVRSLQNMSSLQLWGRQFAQAECYARQALTMARSIFPPEHPMVAKSQASLAFVYQLQGQHQQALSLLQESQRMYQNTNHEASPEVEDNFYNLTQLYAALDQPDAALKVLFEGLDISKILISRVFATGSERQREAYLQQHGYGGYTLLLSLLLTAQKSMPELAAVAYKIVLHRKALLTEAFVVQRDAVLSQRYPHLAQQLTELRQLGSQIADKQLSGPGSDSREQYEQTLAKLSDDYDVLEAHITRQIPEMGLEQQLRQADHQAIAARLPAQSALVEFVQFHVMDPHTVLGQGDIPTPTTHYVAFVLRSDNHEHIQVVDIGDAEELDGLVAEYRHAITGERETQAGGESLNMENYDSAEPNQMLLSNREALRSSFEESISDFESVYAQKVEDDSHLRIGQKLKTKIIDPLLPAITGCTRLLLAPDGDLYRLPFDALPLDEDRYVIDAYELSYLTVGRDVLRFTADSDTSEPPVVAADPNYNLGSTDNKDGPFWHLLCASEEGTEVAKLLEVSPLMGDAVCEHMLKILRSPAILHLATHGFVLSSPPPVPDVNALKQESVGDLQRLSARRFTNPLLLSGLALAGANTWLAGGTLPDEAENGILYAADVIGIDLHATELVVLSACSTGLGNIHVGEGVYGFRRAFVLAGVQTLVTSLWPIADCVARDLMVHFHKWVLKGKGRSTALRLAQREIRRCHHHPRYWAAFVCQGNPEPLARTGTSGRRPRL